MSYIKINETKVYKLAFAFAMKIFAITKKFPKEETYSLTDQIRRSGKSVCSCLAQAHRKRLYPAHFFQKYLIPIWKMLKAKLSLNLHWHVNTLHNKSMMN